MRLVQGVTFGEIIAALFKRCQTQLTHFEVVTQSVYFSKAFATKGNISVL
jgi:hypothetical protein